jgi:hypothetical protein
MILHSLQYKIIHRDVDYAPKIGPIDVEPKYFEVNYTKSSNRIGLVPKIA